MRGKRALVTGAARRLGRAIALHLADAGCDVVAHYHSSPPDAEVRARCRLFQADFTTVSMEQLQARIDAEVGELDILINNASSFEEREWELIDEELWDRELAVNLKVPFFLSLHCGSLMSRRGSGKIINMTDVAAFRPYKHYLPYSIAKAGLVSATQALARAFAPHVQANSIALGTVLFAESQTEEEQQRILKKIPAGRSGTVEELLKTIDFLLSDVDYITGQTIILDGGRSLTW